MNKTDNQVSNARGQPGGSGPAGAGKFTIGGVFSRTFEVFKMNPSLFLCLTAISLLPSLLFEGMGRFLLLFPFNLLFRILNMMFTLVIQGAMVCAVFQVLRHENVTIGSSISKGLRRLFPLIAISFILAVVISLGGFVIISASFRLFGFINGLLISVILLTPLSGLLLTATSVVFPSCLLEKLGALKSINRSIALTSGSRWKIYLLFLVLFVPLFLALLLSNSIIFFFSPTIRLIVTYLIMLFPATFASISWPVLYCKLREAKEGISIKNMPDAFA